MQIGIFGLGLAGAGLGMELRAALSRNITVTGFDPDPRLARKALGAGAVDHTAPAPVALAEAATIFLAVETDALADALRALSPHLQKGTVVSDIGPIKAPGIDLAAMLLPPEVSFVGSHLIDRAGPATDVSDEGRVWCLTPGAGATADAIAAIRELAVALDYRPLIMTPDEHDMYVGATRHLPAMVRAALLSIVAGSDGWRDLAPFSADLAGPSAGAVPTAAELAVNREAITHWLDRLQARLAEVRSQVAAGDEEALSRFLEDSALHEARVAPPEDNTDEPSFSRRVVEGLLGNRVAKLPKRRDQP